MENKLHVLCARLLRLICAMWNYSMILLTIPAVCYIGVWSSRGIYMIHSIEAVSNIAKLKWVVGMIAIFLMVDFSESAVRCTYQCWDDVSYMPEDRWKRIQVQAIPIEVMIVMAAAMLRLSVTRYLPLEAGVTASLYLEIFAVIYMMPVCGMYGAFIVQETLGYVDERSLVEKAVKIAFSSRRRREILDKKAGINGYVCLFACYITAIMQMLALFLILFVVLQVAALLLSML